MKKVTKKQEIAKQEAVRPEADPYDCREIRYEIPKCVVTDNSAGYPVEEGGEHGTLEDSL